MAVYDDLKGALRAALLQVFNDVRLEKTAEGGAEQVSEAFRGTFSEVLPHLGQIEALTPAYNQVIVGDGERWITADRCCDDGGITLPEAQALFSPLDHGHAEYEAAGTMGGHLLDPDPHPDYTMPDEVLLTVDAAVADHVAEDDPHPGRYAPLTHDHDGTYEPAGTMSTHLAASNPHEITLATIGAAAQIHVHPQYQATSQKGNANGYAGLDADGKVPASQLPAAYASTSTTADFGPASGTASPFAGVAVQHHVTAEGITYNGTLGRWTVATAGVYEVSVMLPISVSEAGPVTVIVGGLAVEGLAADTQRRPVAVTVLCSLAASGTVDVIVGAASGTVTVGAGATVSIRRIA